ncbi:hypothetical protein GCM10008931_42910 [Oceanobacillus oncorhynchi subsp. oncorhynchi]|uniref:LAGLIDADG family homing endonuclease n=1 Tax=Oceanobacillus oncorhynchi TaxID=545501 RepID=UPI0031CF95FC
MGKAAAWSHKELDFLKEKYDTMTYREIGNILGRTMRATKAKAERIGLRKPVESRYKYIYNRNYFEKIDCADKAYWMGFIAADGCVHVKSDGCIRMKLTLSKKDKGHLVKFNESLDSNIEIRDGKVSPSGAEFHKKTYDKSEIVINSTRFCRDLISWGITPNKTYSLKLPNFEDKYIKDFLRGFIDGDGSFYIAKRNYNSNLYRYSVDIVGASLEFFEQIQDFLHIKSINSHIYSKRKGNWKLTLSNKHDIVKLIDMLYEDPCIYLDRKYEKAMDMKRKLAV